MSGLQAAQIHERPFSLGPLENLSSLWLHKIYFFLKAKRFDFHAIYLPWDNLVLTVVFGKLKFSSFQSEHIQ